MGSFTAHREGGDSAGNAAKCASFLSSSEHLVCRSNLLNGMDLDTSVAVLLSFVECVRLAVCPDIAFPQVDSNRL